MKGTPDEYIKPQCGFSMAKGLSNMLKILEVNFNFRN